MIAGDDARVTKVAGSSEAGAVDGASACFNQPFTLALDESGHLLVQESGRLVLRVVEASLSPPLRQMVAVAPLVRVQRGKEDKGLESEKTVGANVGPGSSKRQKRGDEDFEVMLQGILPSFLSAFWTQMNSAKVTALLQ